MLLRRLQYRRATLKPLDPSPPPLLSPPPASKIRKIGVSPKESRKKAEIRCGKVLSKGPGMTARRGPGGWRLAAVLALASTCAPVHGFLPAGPPGLLPGCRTPAGHAGAVRRLRAPRCRAWPQMTASAWPEGDVAGFAPGASLQTQSSSGAESAYALQYGVAPVQTYFDQVDRIVAIGDVHGDAGALIACLRMAHCIDEDENWCGGTTHVVQIGDILDRGDEERGCMDLLFRLKHEAAAAGGAVHVLMGNHEAMNVDWDFDYVGLGGFEGWESRAGGTWTSDHSSSLLGNVFASVTGGWKLGGVPRILKDRAKAFTVGTGFAALHLSDMPMVIQLGDTVCVHGGLEMKHVAMDLHRMNVETSEWLRGNAERPPLIDQEDSPLWNRAFSAPADRPVTPSNARKLEHVLNAMGASRMIVGHTPQAGGINSFVTEQGYEVWRTDTGMSRWVKNGPLECLEITPSDGTARVLTRTGVVPGAVRRMEENAVAPRTRRANSGAGERGYVEGSTST